MLQALRREMDARFQRADLELARARQRIRELARQVEELRATAVPVAAAFGQVEADEEAGHCPKCDRLGRICYDCNQYLDGLGCTDGQ
jgi:hypothetical protein